MLCCAQLCSKKQQSWKQGNIFEFQNHSSFTSVVWQLRFLIKQPEALILARVFSRFMVKICAQFSLTIHLMIPLSRDEVFAERLLYSQLRCSFSHQPKHYFHCSTPEVWKYTFSKHIFHINQLKVGWQLLEGSCSSQLPKMRAWGLIYCLTDRLINLNQMITIDSWVI